MLQFLQNAKDGIDMNIISFRTTSAGWINKTNFKEEGDNMNPIEASVQIDIARHHALLFIITRIKEYSQWFKGKKNQVADALFPEFN